MSNSSPLIPQGSLLEEQAKGRPHLRIALCIVAVHMVFLGGLLMQGCKREDTTETANIVLPPLEPSTNYPGLPFLEPTNNAAVLPPATNISSATTDPAIVIGGNELPGLPPDLLPTNAPPIVIEPEMAPEPESQGLVEYKVQRGDYFFSIARKFDITAADIARANPGVDSTRLQIGQVLKIPAASSSPPDAPSPGVTPGAGTGLYTVKKGDTLTRIARQYGTTVSALKEMNGLVTDRIIINQQLKVPAPSGGGTPGN
jgi:LysM repeat protein